MRILFAASEMAPWVKTGGLGDVVAALPPALAALGHDIKVLLPAYPALLQAFPDAPVIARLPSPGGTLPESLLREARLPEGISLLLLESACYARAGNPYLGADGRDWPDNVTRFGLLARIAALLGSEDTPLPWRPEVLHCHDWQTALAPAYLHYLYAGKARAASVVTVHNLAFQGKFGRDTLEGLGLPPQAWSMDGVEFYGELSFLKAGVQFADRITTVSPTYAREIQTDAEGMGMAGLLRSRADRLSGILNGIDDAAWNPALDPLLAGHYDADDLAGKAANKRALQELLGLAPREDVMLFGVVSRLTHQKGLDLLPAAYAEYLGSASTSLTQLAVLGSGDAALEAAFQALAAQHPGQVAVRIGFDERLAHLIEAGADSFLMPSRFEPCGLNQMYSLAYGTPPVVRATGGLADTVFDLAEPSAKPDAIGPANGFVFQEADAATLAATMRRAHTAWTQAPLWQQLQRNGMRARLGWAAPAALYLALYQSISRH